MASLLVPILLDVKVDHVLATRIRLDELSKRLSVGFGVVSVGYGSRGLSARLAFSIPVAAPPCERYKQL